MIPKTIDEWTYDAIELLIASNICESETHDFKATFPSVEVLTNICCSFANTKGGFIVLGIK